MESAPRPLNVKGGPLPQRLVQEPQASHLAADSVAPGDVSQKGPPPVLTDHDAVDGGIEVRLDAVGEDFLAHHRRTLLDPHHRLRNAHRAPKVVVHGTLREPPAPRFIGTDPNLPKLCDFGRAKVQGPRGGVRLAGRGRRIRFEAWDRWLVGIEGVGPSRLPPVTHPQGEPLSLHPVEVDPEGGEEDQTHPDGAAVYLHVGLHALALAPDADAFKVEDSRPDRVPAGPLDLKLLGLAAQEAGQRPASQCPVAGSEVETFEQTEEKQDEGQPHPPPIHAVPPR